MALGGEIFVAPQALALGVVDRVVDTGAGLAEAKAWAGKIAERGPLATEAAKLMIAHRRGRGKCCRRPRRWPAGSSR